MPVNQYRSADEFTTDYPLDVIDHILVFTSDHGTQTNSIVSSSKK